MRDKVQIPSEGHICQVYLLFPQDGASLCYCSHPAWRSYPEAEDEDGS